MRTLCKDVSEQMRSGVERAVDDAMIVLMRPEAVNYEWWIEISRPLKLPAASGCQSPFGRTTESVKPNIDEASNSVTDDLRYEFVVRQFHY